MTKTLTRRARKRLARLVRAYLTYYRVTGRHEKLGHFVTKAKLINVEKVKKKWRREQETTGTILEIEYLFAGELL